MRSAVMRRGWMACSPEKAIHKMAEALISLSNVTCAYQKQAIFQNLSLEIPSGQFVGIVGPNGAGKSTLLRAMLGLIPILSGTILGLGVKERIPLGYVPQIDTVDWEFPVTVEEVVAMGGKRYGLPWMGRDERGGIYNLLKQLGIGSLIHRHIKDLSGGEQRRVFLARALVGNPKLLILDEPTAGVDLKTQHIILHLLGDLNRQGITIVLSTHDLNAVARHLPWVICFNKEIIAQGNPDVIFTPSILSRTYDSEMIIVRQGDVILVDDSPMAGIHFRRPPS